MSSWRLLADIGGSNARFARSGPDGEISAHRNYSVSDFADFDSALRSYLIETESETPCGSAAICAAGPVLEGQVQLTNVPWRICEAATSQLLGNVPVRLINDLEAVALALPYPCAHQIIGNSRACVNGRDQEPAEVRSGSKADLGDHVCDVR